jgi:GT2 family glycosyltransferase
MDAATHDPDAAATAVPVHLVTVLYNSADCLAAFVASLTGQECRHWRLIAVDNASADTGAAILTGAADDRISVVRNGRNLGFARAANQGMRAALAAGAEFVVLINNDTVLPADFLARFLARRIELRADVIAPRIMNLHRPDTAWYAGGHLEHDWILRNIHEPYDPQEKTSVRTVDFASGCCLGISRHALSRAGMLDESFFVYWEDTDFCMRLKALRIPIYYVGDVVIFHEGGHASGGEFSASFNRLYFRSYIQVLRKHFGLAVALRTILRIALKELGRPDKKWHRLSAMLMAMARGLGAPLLPPARL